VLRRPRALGQLDGDGERVVPVRRLVGVGEVIDHLLEPHRTRRRELAHRQHLADDGVAGRVHVHAERRERVLAFHGDEPVLDEPVEPVAGRVVVTRGVVVDVRLACTGLVRVAAATFAEPGLAGHGEIVPATSAAAVVEPCNHITGRQAADSIERP
jgi:hypothetical protein